MDESDDKSWTIYRLHVLELLKDFQVEMKDLNKRVAGLEAREMLLKGKIAVIIVLGGAFWSLGLQWAFIYFRTK